MSGLQVRMRILARIMQEFLSEYVLKVLIETLPSAKVYVSLGLVVSEDYIVRSTSLMIIY
jgi:hypothetical protein